MKLLLVLGLLSALVAVAVSFGCDLKKIDQKYFELSKLPPPNSVKDLKNICRQQKRKLKFAKFLVGACIKNKLVLKQIKLAIAEASKTDCSKLKVDAKTIRDLKCAYKLGKTSEAKLSANLFIAGSEFSANLPKNKRRPAFCATVLTHLSQMKALEEQSCPNIKINKAVLDKALIKLCQDTTAEDELVKLGEPQAEKLRKLLARNKPVKTNNRTALPSLVKMVNEA